MNDIPDVDIEVKNRDDVIKLFPQAIVASQISMNKLVPHISGIYFQKIPIHPLHKIAALPYHEAEKLGYYKIDLLSCHVYDEIKTQKELKDLNDSPINWEWFEDSNFVSTLFHMSGNFTDEIKFAEIVSAYKPKSVEDLAAMVAIKLPSKRYLVGEDWKTIHDKIWIKEDNGLQFKKSHAIAYSLAVVIDAKIKAQKYFSDDAMTR